MKSLFRWLFIFLLIGCTDSYGKPSPGWAAGPYALLAATTNLVTVGGAGYVATKIAHYCYGPQGSIPVGAVSALLLVFTAPQVTRYFYSLFIDDKRGQAESQKELIAKLSAPVVTTILLSGIGFALWKYMERYNPAISAISKVVIPVAGVTMWLPVMRYFKKLMK